MSGQAPTWEFVRLSRIRVRMVVATAVLPGLLCGLGVVALAATLAQRAGTDQVSAYRTTRWPCRPNSGRPISTADTEYAAHRQRFLAQQGCAYPIIDADVLDLPGPQID
jgi:hypothetical protein